MVRLVEDPVDGFLRIRINDAWVAPRSIYLRHNGEWQLVNALRIRIDGEWRAVFVNTLQLQAA